MVRAGAIKVELGEECGELRLARCMAHLLDSRAQLVCAQRAERPTTATVGGHGVSMRLEDGTHLGRVRVRVRGQG